MHFPIFIYIILGVVALMVATVAVYIQIYKRNINKALDTNANTHTSMAPPYKVALVLTIALLFVGLLISYFVGYYAAYNKLESEMGQMSASDIQNYYAEVKEVGDHAISVEGLSINDESYRGEFMYDIWGETTLTWHNAPISLSDLDAGDLVSITLVTDRFGETGIFKIQLLDDEK